MFSRFTLYAKYANTHLSSTIRISMANSLVTSINGSSVIDQTFDEVSVAVCVPPVILAAFLVPPKCHHH